MFLQHERKMHIMAFLVDITSHLNEVNLKLQERNNFLADFLAAVQSFQRKLDIFKVDLQAECPHIPTMKQPIQRESEREVFSHIEFIQKLIGNFSDGFGSLGEQLVLFIQNPFLVRNAVTFSEETTQTFEWVHTGSRRWK